MTTYLVTGNPNKLRELRAIFPRSLGLVAKKLDLPEIQSLDLHEIVRHKLHGAYDQVRSPLIVEDVSAELEVLHGLPGPFMKFFEERMGKGALYDLSHEGAKAKIICTMAYFDGKRELIVDGVVTGTITAPRDGEGFGFDYVFVPDGYDQTFSEMGLAKKNTISHRYRAATALSKLLD